MKSSTPILSWGTFGAVGAGVLFVLLSVLSLAIPKPASFLDVGLIAATLLTVVAVLGLHAVQRGNYGLLGQTGASISIIGSVLNVLSTAPIIAGNTALE